MRVEREADVVVAVVITRDSVRPSRRRNRFRAFALRTPGESMVTMRKPLMGTTGRKLTNAFAET